MRALVVGAGAVGQVYGHHLSRGGARVSMFVREKYAAEARRGYDLFRIHSKRTRVPARFVPDEVLTTADEVGERSFDQAWLTVATPALLRGDLDTLLAATGDATVVSLQPGLSVEAHLARVVSRERTAVGIIGMQSYTAPMEGSDDPVEQATGPGIAYFFPPFVENLFSAAGDRAQRIVDALRAGGAPARAIPDAGKTSAVSAAILIPIVAALETAGWSFDELGRTDAASLGARAAREASAVVAATQGGSTPLFTKLLVGPTVALVATIARKAAPLDIEGFQRCHFTKVGDQTRLMLDEYARAAKLASLDHTALDELRTRLAAVAPTSIGA